MGLSCSAGEPWRQSISGHARSASTEGSRVPFTSVVLATGAAPRHLEVPGAQLSGVHYLRTLDDSLGLAEAIRAARRVAVIGAGWIGLEVAASARQMGADVVIVDTRPVPLQRVLGDEIGAIFARCMPTTAWNCGWAPGSPSCVAGRPSSTSC